jgi:four helix bundle protein
MGILKFEDIISWQKSRILVSAIYKHFESHKDFSFKNQIERAAVSVMNNIAEGFERRTNNEFKPFLFIAKGSVGEVRSMLYIAKDLCVLNENDFSILYDMTIEISKLLMGMIRKL